MLIWTVLLIAIMTTQAEVKILTTGYSSKAAILTFDPVNGIISGQPKYLDVDENLSYCAYDKQRKNLYCVHEVGKFNDLEGTGAISRWTYDIESGTLEKKEVFSSGGADPAHVTLDSARGLLWVTTYTGGSLSVFQLNVDGEITNPPIYSEKIEGGSHVDKDRQEASHLHGTFLFNQFAYVVDLGSDKIFHYVVTENSGKFSVKKADPAYTVLSPGVGPRHMATDTQRNMAYVLNELQNSISIFCINRSTGKLTWISDKALDYEGLENASSTRQYGSAIKLHPNGKDLYISNRGTGAILIFEVLENDLKQVQTLPLKGTWPRDFTFLSDGKYLFVADQFANDISIHECDKEKRCTIEGSIVKSENSPAFIMEL